MDERDWMILRTEKMLKVEEELSPQMASILQQIINEYYNGKKQNLNTSFETLFSNLEYAYISFARLVYEKVKTAINRDIRSIELETKIAINDDEDIEKEFNQIYQDNIKPVAEGLAKGTLTKDKDWIKEKQNDLEQKYNNLENEIQAKIITKENELSALLALGALIQTIQIKRKNQLQRQITALRSELQDFRDNIEGKRLEFIKAQIDKSIKQRARQNTTYIVGQANNDIPKWEEEALSKVNPVVFKKGGVGGIEALLSTQRYNDLKVKQWNELTQYIPKGNPRTSHLILDKMEIAVNELWSVNGYRTTEPRGAGLPVDEVVNCRCQQRYTVRKQNSQTL